jgi:hypothetical protein
MDDFLEIEGSINSEDRCDVPLSALAPRHRNPVLATGEFTGDSAMNDPMQANPIVTCRFGISGDSILTPRAKSRWGLCAAREKRRAVWQREL